MATDLFLIRKNQTFAKYSQVEGISLTSSTTSIISGVTGVTSTDIISLPVGVAAPNAGTIVYFSSLTGGSGLTVSRMYYVLSPSGSTFQISTTPSGSAADLGSNITAATLVVLADDEIKVWSSEYRDMFATQGSAASESSAATFPIASQFSFPGIGSGVASTVVTYNTGGIASGANTTFTPTVSTMSDEAAHAPLRQTLLKRTHWKFDMGATITPRYLYASWQDGDTIANNAPDSL